MSFPTKADIEFFKEAKRIQEEFPGIDSGDWILRKEDNWVFLTVEADLEAEALHLYGGPDVGMVHDGTFHWQDRYILLPRQGQLQEMLEERGYGWVLSGGRETAYWLSFSNNATHHEGSKRGPTPSIALGKALIEALKGKEE